MAKSIVKQKASGAGTALDPVAYTEFIRQIELKSLWLSGAQIDGDTDPLYPTDAQVDISSSAYYSNFTAGSFRVWHTYDVRVFSLWSKDHDQPDDFDDVVTIKVTFAVTFKSATLMTDQVFGVFKQLNLPVNTWPYAREFVSNVMGRMGWLPLTLPALVSVALSRPRRSRLLETPAC